MAGKTRRRFDPDFKNALIDRLRAGEASATQLAEEAGITPSLMLQWRRTAEKRGQAELDSLAELPNTEGGPRRRRRRSAEPTQRAPKPTVSGGGESLELLAEVGRLTLEIRALKRRLGEA